MKHNQKNNKAVHVSEWSCSCAGAQECLKHYTIVSYAVEMPISLSLMGNLIYSLPKKKHNTDSLGRDAMLKTKQWWHRDLFRAL